MPPVLKSTHPPSDSVDDYSAQYGYLGRALHSAVLKLRQSTTTTTSSTVTSSQSAGVTGLMSRSTTLTFQPQVTVTAYQYRGIYVL